MFRSMNHVWAKVRGVNRTSIFPLSQVNRVVEVVKSVKILKMSNYFEIIFILVLGGIHIPRVDDLAKLYDLVDI